MNRKTKTTLAHLARPGACFALRVTPRAGRNALTQSTPDGGEGLARLRVQVTAPPEDGKANRAVIDLLAKALGVAKSRLTLVRGETTRDKLIRLD